MVGKLMIARWCETISLFNSSSTKFVDNHMARVRPLSGVWVETANRGYRGFWF
ncbi:hypothetical protein KCP71_01695 [Salmonella enterica subsp. enterica]|nr:hypothetical protein KCP71_01695 [Salmonella enterica subsp. enterica]